MLSGIWMVCLHTLYLALRVSGPCSFPPPLSAQEERECLERLAAGDLAARDRLIEHNLRLVAHVIKKYYAPGIDQDDLISIGTIGLIKAISSFSPQRGVKLATYTAKCIENEILMFFRSKKSRPVEVSLSEPIDEDCDGNTLALMDLLSVEDDLADSLDSRDRTAALRCCVRRALNEREQTVVILRYGLFGRERELAQREVAALLGISRSYVSRIEKKALAKLKTALEAEKLQD